MAVSDPAAKVTLSKGEVLRATDELVRAGEQLVEAPDWDGFRAWLLASDALLERAWGRMDRYHLAWLNVGRGTAPPGSALDEEGTRRFIVDVARAKLEVLRTMRGAVERGGSPLLSDARPQTDEVASRRSAQEDR